MTALMPVTCNWALSRGGTSISLELLRASRNLCATAAREEAVKTPPAANSPESVRFPRNFGNSRKPSVVTDAPRRRSEVLRRVSIIARARRVAGTICAPLVGREHLHRVVHPQRQQRSPIAGHPGQTDDPAPRFRVGPTVLHSNGSPQSLGQHLQDW